MAAAISSDCPLDTDRYSPMEGVDRALAEAAGPAPEQAVDRIVDAGRPCPWACEGDGWGASTATEPTFHDAAHERFSTVDGYPVYRQGDPEWRDEQIGTLAHTPGASDGHSIYAKGCALTASAMALSKLTGKSITPEVLDAYMKAAGAMEGDCLEWNKLGGVVQPPVAVDLRAHLSAGGLLAQVNAGKPVVFAINHTGGTPAQHWLVATGPTEDGKGFRAIDPATGHVLTFAPNDMGQFECARAFYPEKVHGKWTAGHRDYVATGRAAVFTRAG